MASHSMGKMNKFATASSGDFGAPTPVTAEELKYWTVEAPSQGRRCLRVPGGLRSTYLSRMRNSYDSLGKSKKELTDIYERSIEKQIDNNKLREQARFDRITIMRLK